MVRRSLICYACLLTALVCRLASEPTANISFLILAVTALIGRKEAIQCLAASWLFTMLSHGIAPLASMDAVGRYAVIFCCALSVFIHYRPSLYEDSQKRMVLLTLALGLFFLGHSILFSAMPDVSILKVISWTVTVTTLLAAWGGLSAGQGDSLIQQLFSGLALVMLVSIPLAVSPLGYLRNGTGFQGILNHPQAFGPMIALLGVWVALRLLTVPRPPWKMVLFTGACLVLIVMSEARTAGFSMLGGVISAIVVTWVLSRKRITVLFPGLRSSRVIVVTFCSIFMVIVLAPQLVDRVDAYISKRSNVEGALAAYEKSRGRLMERMWKNIEEQPMTGIGFGVASDPTTMLITRDPIFNLPVGAPIEKGVLPLAVIEEVGLLGFFFVLMWGWSILRRALIGGGAAVGLLGTIVLLNFGESTLFSIGGMGMLPLVLLGWVATRDNRNLANSIV